LKAHQWVWWQELIAATASSRAEWGCIFFPAILGDSVTVARFDLRFFSASSLMTDENKEFDSVDSLSNLQRAMNYAGFT
jgi:hypothetical protein